MRKTFYRVLSALLAVSLLLGTGMFQMSVFADEEPTEIIDAVPSVGFAYMIRQVSSGKYMDVGGEKARNDLTTGNSVVLSPKSEDINLLWKLVVVGDGTYRIVSVGKQGMMLSAFWSIYADGQPINARSRGSVLTLTAAQRFYMQPMDDNTVRIETTGNFLTRDTCISYDGEELVQRGITDDADCRWEFVRVGSAAANFSDWFKQDSSKYNHGLATWAMELSYFAYNPLKGTGHLVPGVLATTHRTIEDELVALGFDDESIFQKGYTTGAPIAHTISHREIDLSDETDENPLMRPLVVVAVRGSGAILDWLMNGAAAIAPVDKLGFKLGRDMVLKDLEKYLKCPNFEECEDADCADNHRLKTPKILITGHSLGAAVANLLTAHINDCTRGETCKYCDTMGLSQNDVYGYTFATPRVERDINTDEQETKHGNLYNILNNNDVVNWIPTTINRWTSKGQRFGRYGLSISDTMDAPFTTTAPLGVFGHAMSTYLSWMNKWQSDATFEYHASESENRKAIGIAPIIARIKCPVDVTIYDKQGNIAAQVINEVAADKWEESGILAWVTEDDGAKNIFMPYGSELSHAHVVARDNGTMQFDIAKGDTLSDDLLELKSFEDITLEKGREYYVDLSDKDMNISDVRLMVTENNTIIGEVSTDGITTVPVKGITIEGEHQRILTVGQETLITVAYTPTLPTNRTIIWDSSNEAVATVDINGVVTAHSPGGAIITGTSQDGGYKAQCIITVEPETEISILGDPTVILNFGQKHQLTADVTINSVSRPITWGSSNEAVAMVSSDGLVTALSLGNAIITATTKDGKTAQVVVNVENETAITIMGDAARILTLGQSHQLTANVTQNSTSLPLTWNSSNEAVALVTANGLVVAQSVGSAMITATTKDGYVAQVMITVEAQTGITIAGDSTRILTQGQQYQLNADVTQNSTSLPLAWTSSNEAIATVTANGLVTAQATGSAIITATTKDGYTAQVLVTVEAGTVITIAGDSTRIFKESQQLQLTANVTSNSTALPLTWTSGSEAVATVSANGLVTALSSGSAVITVTTNDGFTAQVLVTVEGNTTITITGDSTRIVTLGKQQQLTANATDNSTALPVTWSSSNDAVAPVSANGLVTALSLGNAVITATTNDGFMAQVFVTVEAQTAITIAGEPTRILTIGKQFTLTADVTQNSTALPITWSTSNAAVATVSENGIVAAKAIGSAMITATTKDGYTAQVMIAVEAATEISIAGDPTRIIPLNLSEQLFASVTQNSTALPLSWASSNPAVATVNEYGIVAANAIGSAMITATTKDGLSAQVMITVEAPTTLSLSNVPSGKLVVGKTHKLTANVPHNSTALPITWTSSNEAVATISADGVITPKKPGNTIITATTKDGLSEQIIVTVVKAEFFLLRWLRIFFGWLVMPFKWLWNAISWPFRAIGKL